MRGDGELARLLQEGVGDTTIVDLVCEGWKCVCVIWLDIIVYPSLPPSSSHIPSLYSLCPLPPFPCLLCPLSPLILSFPSLPHQRVSTGEGVPQSDLVVCAEGGQKKSIRRET